MTDLLTPMTELEAVNLCLRALSEAPVNTLEAPLPGDAAQAVHVLAEVSRDVQAEGLDCNTEIDYPLVPDVNGIIELPTNAVRVSFPDRHYPSLDVVTRAGKLYDRVARSNVFENTLYVTAVLLIPFDDLPHEHRRYIAVRAARELQQSAQGEEQVDRELERSEARALSAMRRYELIAKRLNLRRGRGTRTILRR